MRWMPRRVALTLALALAPGLVFVFGQLGVVTALRESAKIDEEHHLDARAMARSLAHVLAMIEEDEDGPWPDESDEDDEQEDDEAMEHVAALQDAIAPLDVELITDPSAAPTLDAEFPREGSMRRVVGVATVTDGAFDGAVIVVTEPVDARGAFIRKALLVDLLGVLIAIGLSTGIAVLVGQTVVQRRVDAILARLAAVGRGEMDAPPLALGNDELGVLGRAVNAMVAQLVAAQDRATAEADARRTAELDLRRADRLAVIGQTAAMFAHEVGTPLAVVSGRAARIARRDGPDAGDAQIVVEQAEKIASGVRRMLDYVRHDDGRERRDVVLAEIVRSAADLTADRARQAGVRLELGALAEVAVHGDPAALAQIATNLLNNAVDAGRWVGVQVEGPPPRLVVEDDGPGVPEALRERVFDPFFTTKPAGQGTGLGLAIVRQIAREHGGDARIEARPGGGCRVVVEFPPVEVRDAR